MEEAKQTEQTEVNPEITEKKPKKPKTVAKPITKTVKQSSKQKRMQSAIAKQPTTFDEWLEAKERYPPLPFKVTKQGDLLVLPIHEGDRDRVIGIQPALPATIEHTQDYFKRKRDALKAPEEEYTVAKRALQKIMNEYKKGAVSASDVLDANRRTQDAECRLNNLAKLPRFINNISGTLIERDLTLQHYDDRAVAETVLQAIYTPVPWEAFWMTAKEVEREEAEIATAAASTTIKTPKLTRRKTPLTAQQIAIINSNRAKAASRF